MTLQRRADRWSAVGWAFVAVGFYSWVKGVWGASGACLCGSLCAFMSMHLNRVQRRSSEVEGALSGQPVVRHLIGKTFDAILANVVAVVRSGYVPVFRSDTEETTDSASGRSHRTIKPPLRFPKPNEWAGRSYTDCIGDLVELTRATRTVAVVALVAALLGWVGFLGLLLWLVAE